MKFSVLMSVYKNDKAEYFRDALDSIINQTLPPNQIVIVKDGPLNEELNQIINDYLSRYKIIDIVESKINIGLGNALDLGMKHCKFDIIARMDSDDISVRDRFEKQIKCFIKDKDLSIVGSNISEIDIDKGNIIGYRVVPTEHIDIVEYAKKRCPLNHVTVMFRREDVQKVGGYIDYHYNEDYYLWIRMLIGKCKFKNIDENLVKVRVGKDMYRRRGGLKYFKSEFKLQNYMLDNNIITKKIYIINIALRFIVQIVLPNNLRAIVFKTVCRKN